MADAVIDLPENDPAIDRAVKIIEENLIKEMPDCHVTSLHENDAGYAPLLQKYEAKGLETLIIDMDFYVEEDGDESFGMNIPVYITMAPKPTPTRKCWRRFGC